MTLLYKSSQRPLAMVKYIAVVVFLSGCGPSSECVDGEAKCDGNVASNCRMHSEDHDDVSIWWNSTCGKGNPYEHDRYCVVVELSSGSQGAFCVHSPMTYDQCRSMNLGQPFCVDGKELFCSSNGYANYRGRTCD